MANLGMADSLILMVMALVVFGPRRLPQIGRQIGKLMYEFRKASNDFKFQMEEELRLSEDADRRKKEEERQKAYALAAPKPAEPAASTPSETIAPKAPAPETSSPDTSSTPTSSIAASHAAEPDPADYTSESMIPPPSTSPDHPSAAPRIMPPSSGDPVEAQRPHRAYTQPNPAEQAGEDAALFVAQAGLEADTTLPVERVQTSAAEQAGPAESEQAAHHA